MATMLTATQREAAAAVGAAAAAGAAKSSKGSSSKSDAGSSSKAVGAFSAELLVTEQDVLDVMFTVKVRQGMDGAMVSRCCQGALLGGCGLKKWVARGCLVGRQGWV